MSDLLGETDEARMAVAALVSRLQQHLSENDRNDRIWSLSTDSSGRVSAGELHAALQADGFDASLEDVSSLMGRLESGRNGERVSLADFFGYLRSADATPTVEERIKAAVAATALAPMPAAGQQKQTRSRGRALERQHDLDLARQTARALRTQMERMGTHENRRTVAPAAAPAPSTMTGSFWRPKPYTEKASPAAMQSALENAERRVRQQRLEIQALEKQMAKADEGAGQISERRARARANATAVADAALAEVDAATANSDDTETPVQVELARLRAQKRERGKKHAEAARRRRDGVGKGMASQPLECWRENGVAVPNATYTPQVVPAVEKKRYALEKRRFYSEKKADESRAAQQRELRHVMQGRGSSRFLESRKWVRSLGLRSFAEWLALNGSGARPGHIPADPHRCFANEGWISYEDWLGYKVEDALLLEKVEGARRDAADAMATDAASQLKAKSPPLQSDLAVKGHASTGPEDLSCGMSEPPVDGQFGSPMKAFPHDSAGKENYDGVAYTGWYGWLEARRFATGLGMTRSFLAQLGKASPKIKSILDLSPGVDRFFSDSNPLQAELRECLRHTSERSLAQAYRRWATASTGENESPHTSRPSGIPVHPEQVYQGFAGPWLTWNDWLGLPQSEVGGASDERFLEFRMAKQVARGLHLPNHKAWIELCNSGALPPGLPNNPPAVYNGAWKSWSDWLGCDRGWR